MIIKKIQITNYRSCLSTEFSPDSHLSVIIGPNGTGKTNILNAILLLKKLTDEDEYFSSDDIPPTAECHLKVWFDIDGKKAILTADILTYTDENNSDVVVGSHQKWYLRDFTGASKRFKVPLWLFRHLSRNRIGLQSEYRFYKQRILFQDGDPRLNLPESAVSAYSEIGKQLSQMRYYSASQFTNPANCPVSFEIEQEGHRSRGYRLRGHSKFLFDLYTEYKAKSKGYTQFFDIIGPEGIGLVDAIAFKDILTSSIDYSVRSGGKVRERKREKSLIIPQFRIGKHELSPNQLSEGTFKTITLLFYLVTEASSILLVEEPEVCVHHGLLSSIIELIKNYSSKKQIVISTHSDFVLDKVKPENVHRILSNPETGTVVRNITKTMSNVELRALREYLDKEGNLGEYWRHGALED